MERVSHQHMHQSWFESNCSHPFQMNEESALGWCLDCRRGDGRNNRHRVEDEDKSNFELPRSRESPKLFEGARAAEQLVEVQLHDLSLIHSVGASVELAGERCAGDMSLRI